MSKLGIKLTPAIVVALVIIGIAAAATTFAAISASQNLASTGSVTVSPGLGVYSDSACTIPVSSISWGSLSAGSNVQRTVYIKNTGTGCSLSLSMTTGSWAPANANGPISITWNVEGTRLNPGASATAVITLAVSPSIVDVSSFSVQISLTGTN